MKKTSFLIIACMAMISCSNTYKVKNITLENKADSLSYALGYGNGDYLANSVYQKKVTKDDVKEMTDAIDKGYSGAEKKQYEEAGYNIGAFIAYNGQKGINSNPRWRVNQKIMLQAFTNGLYNDTTIMDRSVADAFLRSKVQASHPEEGEPLKPIKGSVVTKVKPVVLKSELDSINYAFGYLNGTDVYNHILSAPDINRDEAISGVLANLEEGLKHPTLHFQEMMMFTNFGKQLKQMEANNTLLDIEGIKLNYPVFRQGFVNGMWGDTTNINSERAGKYINAAMQAAQEEKAAKQAALDKEEAAERIAAEEAFLAENAKRNDIVVTESGLQYKVVRQGKGPRPTANDRVTVHYHGTLMDGTVFDSSVERKQPATFGVTQVIPGWVEVLQLMPVGSKYKVYIPYELGYNSRRAGKIPPFSMLIFDIELIDIVKPEAEKE